MRFRLTLQDEHSNRVLTTDQGIVKVHLTPFWVVARCDGAFFMDAHLERFGLSALFEDYLRLMPDIRVMSQLGELSAKAILLPPLD